jgi:tetratricopeptide (TPR) repeat protein
VQRLHAANELANENSDEAVRALSMALQGFLVNAEAFVDDSGALDLRTLTQLNLVRALLARGLVEEANEAMDEAIRSALGKPIPAHRLGPVVAELYEARLAASTTAGRGEIAITCAAECIVLVNERTVRGMRAAELPLGIYRVHAIRRDFGAKYRTEATIGAAGAVAAVHVTADFDGGTPSMSTSMLSGEEYMESFSSAIELSRASPSDGIGPLLLLLADSPKYTEVLAGDPAHQNLRQRGLLALAMAYLAVGDRDAATFALDEAIRSSFDGRSSPAVVLNESGRKLFEERKRLLEADGRADFSVDCTVDCQVFVNELRVNGPVSLLRGSYRVRVQSADGTHVDSVVEIDCSGCEVRRIFRGEHLEALPARRDPRPDFGGPDFGEPDDRGKKSTFAVPGLAVGGALLMGIGAIGGLGGTVGFGVATFFDERGYTGVAASVGAGAGCLILGGVLMALAKEGVQPRTKKRRPRTSLTAQPGFVLSWRF